MEEALKALYYSAESTGSYGGVERLLRAAVEAHVPDITRDAVRDFLSRQRAYTLHKPARRHFIRNRTYVGKIDKQWQADLADMVGLTRDNGGNRYILTVIDIFSKYAWAVPVKNKDGKSVRDAFKLVLASAEPRTPERLQTDKGKEFFNREFADLMRNNGIQHFASESDQKAAVVERFNRTLKTRIWTYLSAKRTKKWAYVLPAILTAYNGSYHRSIGMAPNKVTAEDQDRIWTRLYGDGDTYLKRKHIADGANVRISRVKGVFDKGYMPNWSREQFTVASTVADGDKRRRNARSVVTLKDESGEELRGKWYPEEIQQVRDNDYEVEKVLKRRTAADGTRELFVKWRDYPSKYNSWITERDLTV
jgi:hypothetical protein